MEMSDISREKQRLKERIQNLLHQDIRIKYNGPQALGNTWQEALGVPINNLKISDWPLE